MKVILHTVILFLSIQMMAQSEWENYSAISNISEIEVYGSKAYVSNAGGLLIVDLDTKEEKLLIPSNSDFQGNSFEVEFLNTGHAWVSGLSGLRYYDGQNFELTNHVELSKAVRPSNLRISNDVLWFIDYYGALFSFENDVLTDHSSLFPEGVQFFEFTSNGEMWMISGDEIVRYNGADVLYGAPVVEGEIWAIYNFFIDDADKIWVSLRINGAGGGFEVVSIEDLVRDRYGVTYRADAFFNHNSFEVSFSNSYGRVGFVNDGELWSITLNEVFPEVPEDSGAIKLLKWDLSGAWLTTTKAEDYQIHRVTNQGLMQYGINENFLGGASDLKVNCNGTLFKAGYYNLEKFVDEKWESVYPDYFDPSCNINYLHLNPFTCEVWGSGFGSNVNCPSLWKITEEEILEFDVLDEGVFSLAFGKDKEVYLEQHGQLHVVDSVGRLNLIEIENAFAINHFHMTSAGVLWCMGYDISDDLYEAYFVLEGGQWSQYSFNNAPLPESLLPILYEDDNGNLWFAHDLGLVRFDGEEWKVFELDGDFFVSDIIMDDIGNFWISTRLNGLLYWDMENYEQYSISNSDIFSNNCYGLERVGDHLWIEHGDGLSRMKLNDISSTQAPPAALPEPQFTLYPNPSAGPFHVKNETMAERRYEVYSINGDLVLSETSDRELWSGYLEPGVYIVKVLSSNGESVEKLIIL